MTIVSMSTKERSAGCTTSLAPVKMSRSQCSGPTNSWDPAAPDTFWEPGFALEDAPS